MSPSTVPALLSGLQKLIAEAMPGAVVLDGEPTQGQPGDFVAVGYSRNGNGVVGVEQITDYGLSNPLETYDVTSEIVAWTGGTDLSTCRTRAYVLLDAVGDALRADPTVGGVVLLAQLQATDLAQMQTTKGAVAVLAFTVHVQASKH